jgi:hypothetical protein
MSKLSRVSRWPLGKSGRARRARRRPPGGPGAQACPEPPSGGRAASGLRRRLIGRTRLRGRVSPAGRAAIKFSGLSESLGKSVPARGRPTALRAAPATTRRPGPAGRICRGFSAQPVTVTVTARRASEAL